MNNPRPSPARAELDHDRHAEFDGLKQPHGHPQWHHQLEPGASGLLHGYAFTRDRRTSARLLAFLSHSAPSLVRLHASLSGDIIALR